MSEQPTFQFGITKETKDSNKAPLLVATKVENNAMFPSGWKFPVSRLVSIVSNHAYKTKNGDKAVLQFIFKDSEGRQHVHIEWEQDPNDAKFDKKYEGLNVRIKHIYTAIFTTFPEGGIGKGATSFADYFDKIREDFYAVTTEAKEGEERKLIFPTVGLFTKVTYFNGNLGFPLSPNFLEKAVQGQACKLLTINLKHDKLEAESVSKPAGIPGMPSTPSADALPDFGTGGFN